MFEMSEAIEISEPVRSILTKYGIEPSQHLEILKRAFTHASLDHQNNYEILELIGDAVINLAVKNWLSDRHSDADPGKISIMASSIVSRPSLAFQAHGLELDQMLRYNKKNWAKTTDRILCDLLEALVGAIFTITDNDWNTTSRAALELIGIEEKTNEHTEFRHPVTQLQEMTQGMNLGIPEYHFHRIEENSRDTYSCRVIIGKSYKSKPCLAQNKSKAKMHAALQAIHDFQHKEKELCISSH